MAFKISINLPGQVSMVVESTESDLIKEIVSLVLRDLQGQQDQVQIGDLPREEAIPNGQDSISRSNTTKWPSVPNGKDYLEYPGIHASTQNRIPDRQEIEDRKDREARYMQFASSLAPVGDMRRVVVAAEGARTCLDLDSVSEVELGYLFDLAGWRQPGDFLQTLRNSARTTFRWLERVPGRPGYYSVSDEGQAAVIDRSVSLPI